MGTIGRQTGAWDQPPPLERAHVQAWLPSEGCLAESQLSHWDILTGLSVRELEMVPWTGKPEVLGLQVGPDCTGRALCFHMFSGGGTDFRKM